MNASDLPSVEDMKALGIIVPDFYQRFIAQFGEQAALTFCLKHGGRQVFVPRKLIKGGSLTKLVGRAVAAWLTAEFGNRWLPLPIWIRSHALMHKLHVRRLIRDGHSNIAIVELAMVSNRQVSRERVYMRERHLVNFPPAEGEAAR
jgi:hypothetical protein